MFEQIRLRLLTSYLIVLASILITFAVGVRVLFAHVLSQKITEKLTTIAQSTMTSVEMKNGRLQFDSDLPPRQISPEASFHRLQQFTADASHELRSPLMAIKTNAQVALKYPTGMRDGDLDKFESIASATTQMTKLTEDLLWLARSDGIDHQQWERIDLTELLADVLQTHQALALSKKIDLHGEVASALSVTGDRSQLLQVFTNLVENALHYTPYGGIVTVTAERMRQQIVVKIQDTGVGIAPEHLSKIFDRFWRADTSRTQWEGGSGLGLSIVQSIVARHGGKITVMSEIGGGSCFTVRLPLHFT